MSSFDVKTADLNGLNLIEASAGTGKTYTLAELYLRLIVEHELNVDQILVVTYTRAATEELRDRLRQKLVDARDEIDVSDIALTKLFQRLNLAIQSFDEAAIYTIHGFCQRVLSDFAFESGVPFDLELIGDDIELLQSATEDFWRRHVVQADADFTAFLLSRNESPQTLLQAIRPLLGKPYLQVQDLPNFDAEKSQAQLQQQFETVKKLWVEQQDDVIAALTNKALLNGNKYRSNSVEKWLLTMIALCEQQHVPAKLFKDFDRFTPAKLEDALKKGQILPELSFWTACETLQDLHQQLQSVRLLQIQQLRLELLNYLQTTLPALKQQQQVQSYDDLLLNLDAALTGEQGPALIDQLRTQYQAALIDEFQDTDPVQYASFSRIYAQTGLPTFFVGDPKQAIYSFRGADIFTYLTAKSAAEKEHTLTKNWRSHPLLVKAVNTIFEQVEQPFLYAGIPFYAVDAARENRTVLQVENKASAPMQLVWQPAEKELSKKEMSQFAAADTANQIAQILNQSQQGFATLEEGEQQRAISGGDIAVLVRNHRQATLIQEQLRLRGINSVQQGRDNVFASAEAVVMLRLLMAVNEPNQDRLIAAVLTTPLFNLTANELFALQQDEPAWMEYINLFHQLHQQWCQQGFMTLFRTLLVDNQVQQRVLSQVGGERQITNLLHLAELIQDYCIRENTHMEAAIQWLNTQRLNAQTEQDAAQIRLESDEQLVKIITIHKSKGLEYPIVFCPFLWDVNQSNRAKEVMSYHEPEQNNQALVALAEPQLSRAEQIVSQEEKAEDLRLLYVALTRARERCVIFWGAVKGGSESALYSLMHPNTTDISAMQTDLQSLAQQYPDCFELSQADTEQVLMLEESDSADANWQARIFSGHIQAPWRIGSFSSLTAGHDAELPDYDASNRLETTTPQTTTQLDRFAFPKGAQAGTCLHSIFELWDFQDNTALAALASKQLALYGFDDKWLPVVCEWLEQVVATPLVGELSLNKLSKQQRLDEMAFYFPAVLTSQNLQQGLAPYLSDDDLLSQVIKRLSFYDLSGFMKGFIDLVFEHQGQYFVVDYKSNYLGNEAENYQPSALNEAMLAHDYPLQYLLYSLALHRYLSLRLPDYDPETHLGGVAYLFIRGMKPEWGTSGIFYRKVDTDLLLALDELVKGVQYG